MNRTIVLIFLLLAVSADAGTLRTSAASGASAGGAFTGGTDTYCIFNDAGTFGQDAGCTYTKGTDALVVVGSIASAFFASTAADPADAGVLRLGNAETISWESAPTGTDITVTVNSAEQLLISESQGIATNSDMYLSTGSANIGFQVSGGTQWLLTATELKPNPDNTEDFGLATNRIRTVYAGTSVVNNGSNSSATYLTATNCSDSAGDAACAAAPAGSVVIDAADTTVVVSTTAVTANSQIFIFEDSSLGARLSVTCNTTIVRIYVVTARTAGTSFTITTSAAPVTNPACLSYFIVN